jgi:hypothetical protein
MNDSVKATQAGSSIYLDGEYGQKNPTWHVEHSAWKAGYIMQAMAFLPCPPATICEIGCGAGEILRQLDLSLAGSGAVELVGYDVSPQAIALAREREGSRLSFVLGDSNSDGRHFDLLLGIDVIEHMEDAFAFLRNIRTKADYFVFHIPLEISCEHILRGFVMESRKLYGHIQQYTRETALATLQECGYTILQHFYTPNYECMPDNGHTRITKRLRRMIFALHRELSPRLISGCSLMVLARS